MLKANLLATALCGLVATGALAQTGVESRSPAVPQADHTQREALQGTDGTRSSGTTPGVMQSQNRYDNTSATRGAVSSRDGDLRGLPVEISAGDDAGGLNKTVGTVTGVVRGGNGEADRVVVDLNNSVTADSRSVALDYSELRRAETPAGRASLVYDGTIQDLRDAPSYEMAAASRMDSNGRLAANAEPTRLKADDLIGATVYGANNEDIGEVEDLVVEPQSNRLQAIVVDVGGFLGIGEKTVAMNPDQANIRRDSGNDLVVHTDMTQAQLERQRSYDAVNFRNDPDAYMTY